MNQYSLFRSFKSSISRFRETARSYSMRDKRPTITVTPDPLEIEDKPFSQQNQSYAMRVYMENVNNYNKFMKNEQETFETGKRHLANMMGRDPASLTEEDIDESIRYLFPCALFAKPARPVMKPPEKLFPPRKEAEFDTSGRPYHPFFYTILPNYYELLHKSVKILKDLDDYEDKVITGKAKNLDPATLELRGSKWISLEELEKLCCERLKEKQYQYFIKTLERVVAHPCAIRAEEFIMKYRNPVEIASLVDDGVVPIELEDGRKMVRYESNKKKSTIAHVNVIYPGTGKLCFNGMESLHYFENIQAKEQIMFPLLLSKMLNKVDIEAEIHGGLSCTRESTCTAGAVRLGISRGLSHFVDEKTRQKMTLAGLLERDKRRAERQKPGQKGARAKYKWRKR